MVATPTHGSYKTTITVVTEERLQDGRPRMRMSPRQEQILWLIAEGYSDKEIARELGISAKTIETHLQRLYGRYQVRTRAAVIAKWLRDGTRLDRTDRGTRHRPL
jgi:DNA-binding NarL/FixJ family response regulator